jgi:hypothetical protein
MQLIENISISKFNKVFFTILSFAIISLAVSGCYYDKEEVLYPSLGNSNCDTTNVTYSKTIAPLISDNCGACHGTNFKANGGGIRLDNYNDLVAKLDQVIGSVNHKSNYEPMPKNTAKLNDCKLKKLTIWFQAGAPNN